MKRTKLSVSAPGSILPSSTWYKVPRCFACDDPIKSHRLSTSLLLGKTQYSHSSIPGKLGEYIGDGFVVVVTSQDALCRNCMNLLNTMDRLEEELKSHRTRFVGNLRRKYGLDPGGNQDVAKLRRKQIAADEDDDIIEIQSDEEWTPYNKKRKVTPTHSSRSKALTCNVCKMEFTDLNRFMMHLKQHKELKDRVSSPKETVIISDTPRSFKCGCCTLSFDKKETLAAHMRLHTGEKQLSHPVGASSQGDTISVIKNKFPLRSNNGSKLFPKPTSETVVEMKLIMGAGHTTGSTVQTSQALEKPVTVTKVTEKDPGGKVCLLALWNSGSCTDHADCQNPACGTGNNSVAAITTQQIPHVAQREVFIPRLLVKQTQDSVPEVLASQPVNMSDVLSQSQFQITSVGQQRNLSNVPSTSQANTHIVSIPHSVHSPTQIPVKIRGSSDQPVSQIVISVPNQTSEIYNTCPLQTSSFVQKEHTVQLNPSDNQGVILNTSDDVLPRTSIEPMQISDKDQKSGILSSSSVSIPSTTSSQGQPSNITLGGKLNPAVSEQNHNIAESGKGNRSMPSLDDDIVEPVITERTIVEHDEMGNLAIVTVNNVDGSETAYNPKDDETDWFLASEQSNAGLEPPHTLWGNHDNLSSGLATIDQVDGMRSASTLPFEAREQSDSVDEDEKSEYFTSRYVVDPEKIRQEAEALVDAISAALKS